MRDASLLRRELQSPFVHKLLDEGEDFVFQHVLGRTGDDEVIRIPNQVDFRNASNPSKTMFANVGEIIPPCGVPALGRVNK
jgi:hypothetical protein